MNFRYSSESKKLKSNNGGVSRNSLILGGENIVSRANFNMDYILQKPSKPKFNFDKKLLLLNNNILNKRKDSIRTDSEFSANRNINNENLRSIETNPNNYNYNFLLFKNNKPNINFNFKKREKTETSVNSNLNNDLNNDNYFITGSSIKNNYKKSLCLSERNPSNKNAKSLNYSIDKIVKNIRNDVLLEKEIENDKKYYKNKLDNFLQNNNFSYDNDNLDVVALPKELLCEQKIKRSLKNMDKDINDLDNFINSRKENLKHNIMIKIMKNKHKKDLENIANDKVFLEDKFLNLDNNKKYFKESPSMENTQEKIFNESLYKINENNKEFYIKKEELENDIHLKKEDILIVLKNIEKYRNYVRFVCKILGDNNFLIFDKEVINDKADDKYSNIDFYIGKVLNNYDKFFNQKSLASNIDEDVENNIDYIYHKFDNLENKLYYLCKTHIKQKETNDNIKQDNIDSIINLKNTIKGLEQDYEDLVKKVKLFELSIKNNECETTNKNVNGDSFYFNLLADLSLFVIDSFKEEKSMKHLDDNLIQNSKKCINILKNKENWINNIIVEIEKYEKEDNELFLDLINRRKYEALIDRLEKRKKLTEKTELNKKIESEERFGKIIIKSRLPGPLYNSSPKKKVVKIDPKVQKQKEDGEILFY